MVSGTERKHDEKKDCLEVPDKADEVFSTLNSKIREGSNIRF